MISPALSVTHQVEHVLQWIDVTFLKICRGIGERRYVKYCILCAYESPVPTEIFIKPKKNSVRLPCIFFILCSRLGIYRTDEHASLLIPWQPHIQLWKPHHIRILSIGQLSAYHAAVPTEISIKPKINIVRQTCLSSILFARLWQIWQERKSTSADSMATTRSVVKAMPQQRHLHWFIRGNQTRD